MSELLPPEMELHKRQDAVLEAALAWGSARLTWLRAPYSEATRFAPKEYLEAEGRLIEATDALQAWHVENCK